jgi:hypothetical protein
MRLRRSYVVPCLYLTAVLSPLFFL